MSNRSSYSKIALAAAAASLMLSGCSGDQLTSSVRPNVVDKKRGGNNKIAALMRVAASTAVAGDMATAVGLYRRAHELDPLVVAPLIELGKALAATGDNHGAAEAFQKAMRVAKASSSTPQNMADAAHGLGNALVSMEQPKAAITQFEYAMTERDDPRHFNGIGVAHDMLGQHGTAQAYYRTGLEVDPDNIELLNNLGLSLAIDGKFKSAITVLKRIAYRPGATSRHRLNLALALGLAGRMVEAADLARRDLDETSVLNNLAYYETLRAMKDSRARLHAIGSSTGGHFTDPDRPGSSRKERNILKRGSPGPATG